MSSKTNSKETPPKEISVEPWELLAVHLEFPTHSEDQLKPAIKRCMVQKAEIRSRQKLAECVSDKIKT